MTSDPDDEIVLPERASNAHFQLYGPEHASAVRWRLLSGNNRDMGRSVLAYRDAAACRAGILEVLARLDSLEPIFVPDGHNSWHWFLRYQGESIVTSGHAYDRKVRCKDGHMQFLRHAPGAQIKGEVVISSTRRWSMGGVIDLRDRVDGVLGAQRGITIPPVGSGPR